MQVTADSIALQHMLWAKNAQFNHSYEPTITLRQSENECLLPVALVREYLGRTKDGEQISEKLFVTRKMGPVTAISYDTVASWLKKTLTWPAIGLQWVQIGKLLHTMLPARETVSKQLWKQVTGLTLPLCMGTTSGAIPEKYWLGSLTRHQEASKK